MIFPQGQIGSVDSSDRVSVPSDILKSTGWWTGRALDAMSELAEPGLIRIFAIEAAMPLIEETVAQIERSVTNPGIRFTQLQVLHDRYRKLKLYSDGRLRFTREVASVLGFQLGGEPQLYVQPCNKGFEIMSLPFREKRLLQGSSATTIGLHLS